MGARENAIVRNLEDQGFVKVRQNKHIVMVGPGKVRLVIPTSMGRGGRALANTAAQIRRAGFTIGRPKRGGRPGMV